MLEAIVAKLLGAAGFGFLDRVLGHIERKADNVTERQRINAGREKAANAEGAGVVKEGMKYKVFWIPWLIAAVPTAAWFGWGMTDSLFNGALPDVAELPPQLQRYADIVFNNIFYSGVGMGGIQALSAAVRHIRK